MHENPWILSDDEMPQEGEYILGCAGEECPVFITRWIDGEWDTGANHRRPCYIGDRMYKTNVAAYYWMPLPKSPQREK